MTALEVVMEHVEKERLRLEKEAEQLLEVPEGAECEALQDVYERLDELDFEVAKKRAIEILRGLGFTTEMQVWYSSQSGFTGLTWFLCF